MLNFSLQELLFQFFFVNFATKVVFIVMLAVYWTAMVIAAVISPKFPSDSPRTAVSGGGKYGTFLLISHFLMAMVLLTNMGNVATLSSGNIAMITGIVIAAVGIIFAAVSRYNMGPVGTGLNVAVFPGRPLPQGWPYKMVRHPFLLGLFLMWTGFSVMFVNWIGVVISFAVLLPISYKIARDEEESYFKVFGQAYYESMPERVILP